MSDGKVSEPSKPQESAIHPSGKPGKGSGDPVQRAAREERIKQNLRDNLRRRKQKARAVTADDKQGSSE